MDDDVSAPGRRWARRILGAAFLVAPFWVMWRYSDYFLMALPLLIIGAGLWLPELSRPIAIVVDAIFGTAPAAGGKPPLSYTLARYYVKEERLDEALEEYRRIMRFYPRELEPYVEGMKLTAELGGGRKAVKRLYARGKRRVREPGERWDLKRGYDVALERVTTRRATSGR